MQTSSRPSSRQFGIPGKPEAGLAEWTERIKAMQRQVDADEEEEHRRLEDEIRASRLARARRSAQSRSGTPSSPSPYQRERSLSPAPDEPVRQREQADALLKLTGGGPPSSSSSSRKPEPTSLAAFIGGRATGPRLNKHAPQIDAHDPTLFDQRRIDSGSKPHPVFGRGGVAMPGLANKGRTRTEPIPEVEHDTVPIPVDDALPANGRSNGHDHSHGHVESSQTPKRERKNSNALKRYIDHVDQRTGKPEPIRTRTMSTPASPVIARAPAPPISPSLSSKPPTAFASTSLRSASANMAPTPAFPTSPTAVSASTSTSPAPKSPAYSKPSLSASASPKARASTAPTPAPVSPKPKPKPPHLGSNNSSPKAVVTPSLARPIQPAPKPSPFAPQTPPSVQPSPAFLRAQHNGPKDLTPSLTRLKGRGFVQSIVQASSQLSGQSSQPDELGQIQGGGSGGKKLSSVVDRWKTVETESEPAAPPPKKSFRKSWTAEASTPVHKSVESELAPVAPPPKKALRKSWTAEVPVVAPVQDKVVNRVPFTASLEREDEETEPSWKEIEEEARKVDRKTSATSLRDKASGPSLHKKSSSGVLRKKPSSGALRKKSSSSALRKKSSAASLRAPEADDDAGMRPPSPGGRPMGSSSTMFSYIKPMKTGDDASQSAAHSRPTTPGLGKARSDVGGLPPSGTPLSHLTKDRAKRPKKGGVAGPRDKNEVSPSSRQADVQPRPPPKQQQQPQQPRLQQQIAFPSLVGDAPQPEASKRPSIADRWAGQAVLGAKAVEQQPTPPPVPEKDRKGMVGARALPGLAIAPTPSTSSSTASSATPSPSPRPHRRRERIPSTGNRATVMDVALIMHEREASLSSQSRGSPSPTMPSPSTGPPSPLPTLEPPERAPAMERRRSSYSSFNSLPPVSEVRTPAPTLPRKAPPPVEEDVPPVPVLPASAPVAVAPPVPEKVLFPIAEPVVEKKEPEVMHIRHKDGPLPSFDVGPLVAAAERSRVHVQSNNISTISVEVLSIVGASANALPPAEAVVFYEGETLAVIHRFKTRASGLVATKVWCWRGKGAATGELEEAKLEGLARRYAAPLLNVRQAAEPAELVHVLGGRIAIRQGFRSLWSAENTTMHCVQLVDGNIIMDELDLAVSNMCSGFSYCVTLLGSSYVWHGRGSLPQEREAALVYARALAADGASIVELVEDESDDDEMFWMMLGEREYARADYWRWRCQGSEAPAPAVWAVDAANAKAPLTAVSSAINQASTHDSVYLIYCTWELFVLVGKDARGKRADIRLALAAAQAMSSRMAGSRPFDPPVHIVILPSQIPQDLRFHLRGLNEDLLNDGDTPDHMNLLSVNEALNHLEKVTWTKLELRYPDMLPLGLDVTHIPS